jgi:protein-S-isoprenylcysteine O-methyltransferase Ste14
MTIPVLGPRGEGWVVAQVAFAVVLVLAGLGGPRWFGTAAYPCLVVGIAVGILGCALLVAGVAGLGRSLTPFPKPAERSTLRVRGAYRVVRHPIYGGFILIALGWSLMSSPLALCVTVFLAVLLELKSRREESMLVARYPEYEGYLRRVRWRFVPGVH